MIIKIFNILIKTLIKIKAKGKITFGKNVKVYSIHFYLKNNSILEIKKNARLFVGNHIELNSGSKMTIGQNTTLNKNNQLYGDLKIGDHCVLASEIYISSYNHNFKDLPHLPIKVADKELRVKSKPVILEGDIWIGKGAIIMPGVYISKGCIIGANTIVNKSIYKPYSIYYGSKKKLGLRHEIVPEKKILMKARNFPSLYRGFTCDFKKGEIESITGSNVFLLIKKPEASKRININLPLKNNLEQLSLYPNDIKVNIDRISYNSETNNEIDFNLKSVSNRNQLYLINIKFKKQTDLINLSIEWT